MNEIPPEGMNDEEDDEFIQSLERLNQLMENLTPSQRENIPEIQTLFTLFCIKEDKFEQVLKMLRQSIENLAIDPDCLAKWRSSVQAKLRETSNEELELDDSQRQQIERIVLGLEE
jgi:hypothetical protein